ncbi:MAG: TlpA disulfide reductase family protein [Ferruginibacter sp.]
MRLNFQLLLFLLIIAVTTKAQIDQFSLLNIGDQAPPLRVRDWIKGEPVQRFEKGHVYVLEFWATWCKPCIAAMPHLSILAGEYKDRVSILGIDIYEKKTTSIEKIKAFVDSMGHRMDYNIATEDSNLTVADWLEATGEKNNGIPNTFVVDPEGRLAWIGRPKDLDEVLPKIVNNTWDVKEELAKRNSKSYLKQLDEEANDKLNNYTGDANKQDYIGKPDSALLVISDFLKKEPKLKYAPLIASHTFSAFLKTDPRKAYEYGKAVIVTSTYDDPHYSSIWSAIEWYSDKINLPAEIYELGAETYQARINAYPETSSPNFYYKMAGLYWRANDKSKAIDAAQKAIDALKNEKNFSATQMASFKSRLQQYKNK